MSLEKLFENIDSTILTDDLKNSLKESFDVAVNEKAEVMVSEKLQMLEEKSDEYAKYLKEEYESKASEYEDKLSALDEKADEYTQYLKEEYETKLNSLDDKANGYAEYLKEEYETKIETLTEKANEYVELMQSEMNEKVSDFLDRAIQEFIVEAKEQMCINVENAKANALTESFSQFAITAGVEVADIVEAYDDTKSENKLQRAIEENDNLVNENLSLVSKIKELNEKVNNLLKIGVIKEMSDGMTLCEAKKFENLAELVEFTNDSSYIDSLTRIAEAVKGEDDENDDDSDDDNDEKNPKDNKKEQVNESTINLDHQKVNETDFNSSINERLNRLI